MRSYSRSFCLKGKNKRLLLFLCLLFPWHPWYISLQQESQRIVNPFVNGKGSSPNVGRDDGSVLDTCTNTALDLISIQSHTRRFLLTSLSFFLSLTTPYYNHHLRDARRSQKAMGSVMVNQDLLYWVGSALAGGLVGAWGWSSATK